MTTPSAALRKLRDFLLMPQPPLLIELIEEGSSPTGTAATPDFDTLDKLPCLWRTTLAEDRAILFMRYIRKQMDTLESARRA